jgi:hypothetical protein
MSDVFCLAQTSEVALTGGVERTVLMICAPANQRVRLLGWGVFFDGIYVTAQPVEVTLYKVSVDGTLTPVTVTKTRPAADVPTPNTTAKGAATGADPTVSEVVDILEVHPQAGYEVKYPLGQEIVLAGGEKLAIKCLAAETVNVRAKMHFEE